MITVKEIERQTEENLLRTVVDDIDLSNKFNYHWECPITNYTISKVLD